MSTDGVGQCRTCQHWHTSRFSDGGAECTRIERRTPEYADTASLDEYYDNWDVLDTAYLRTGPLFGCVMHEPRGTITSLTPPRAPDGYAPLGSAVSTPYGTGKVMGTRGLDYVEAWRVVINDGGEFDGLAMWLRASQVTQTDVPYR